MERLKSEKKMRDYHSLSEEDKKALFEKNKPKLEAIP